MQHWDKMGYYYKQCLAIPKIFAYISLLVLISPVIWNSFLFEFSLLVLLFRGHCVKSVVFGIFLVRIQTEYGEILHIPPYLVQMWENTEQKNSKYGHFLRSGTLLILSEVTLQ